MQGTVTGGFIPITIKAAREISKKVLGLEALQPEQISDEELNKLVDESLTCAESCGSKKN